jgi:drug/metabolite transporter (DMT)-like permease
VSAAGAPATPEVRRALLQIHLCVVLWGFTAILGKLISLPAFELVWWRMLLVVAAIALWPPVWRSLAGLDRGTWLRFGGAGVIVALHWVTFYGSIKLANASVAATCMAIAPIFMAVIEPRLARRAFDARELVIGVAALPGVALVMGGTPGGMRSGLAMGVLSALLVAIFGSLNKRHVERADPLVVTGVELASGTAFLTLVAAAGSHDGAFMPVPDARDALLLGVLSLGCTLLPFVLAIKALRHTSAFTAQLAISLEPVYAVLLAMVLLGEQRELEWTFYLGVVVILGSVFAHTAIKLRSAAP